MPIKYKSIQIAFLTSAMLSACGDKSPETPEIVEEAENESTLIAQAELSNPSSFDRNDEHIYFSYYDLGLESATTLAAYVDGFALPSQNIDSDGDGSLDGLLVQVDLPVGAIKNVNLERNPTPYSGNKRTQAEISHKVDGTWQAHAKVAGYKEYVGGQFQNVDTLTPPDYYTDHSNWIRYEGPGIESDKVGYRIYLDWRNGFDIFGKIHPETTLQNVGQDGYDSYHEMQDWGMDILKVGTSLGAGGFASFANDKLEFVKDTQSRTATITNNGDIFSSFKISYAAWQRSMNTTDLDAVFSMSAGSRLAKVQLHSTNELGPIGIGIVKHDDTDFVQGEMDIPGDTFTYIGSWGKQSLNKDKLGMAVIFRKRTLTDIVERSNSHAAILKTPGNEFEYYFVAAWEGEHNNGIQTKEDFVKYLEMELEKLTIPVRVRLKTSLSEKAKQSIEASGGIAKQALNWSQQLADSELNRKALGYHYDGWDVNRKRLPKFEYDIVGWLPLSYYKLAAASGNDTYSDVLDKVTASFIENDGNIKRYSFDSFNIDAVAPGSAVLALYQKTQEEKYKLAADLLRHQLEEHPKTSEGAFWHKQKYDSQLWLDGVFMGMPFLAEYSMMFENGASLEEVVNEFKLTRKYLRDPKTGLYYHGWDEKKAQDWADNETGLSPEFWARGLGWLAMASVDVLDFIPQENSELREPILQIINELAESIEKVQDPETGTWWQVLDKADAAGNYRESSATAMFAYFYAKAARLNYLDEKYRATAIRAYEGLIKEFVLVHTDGQISMTNQCYVAGLGFGRDGSYRYYMSEMVSNNDIKGVFPFMLAGIEVDKLVNE